MKSSSAASEGRTARSIGIDTKLEDLLGSHSQRGLERQAHRRRIAMLMLVPVCLLLGGCSEATHIYTVPPGASVRVNGRELGTAPVKLQVKSWSVRPNAYHYHIEKPGYLTQEGYIQPHLSVNRIVAAALSWCFTCSFHGFFEFDEETEIALQPDPPPPSEDPAATQLRRLQKLYDQGLISSDEFRRSRGEVVREIVKPPPEKQQVVPLPNIVHDLLGPILRPNDANK